MDQDQRLGTGMRMICRAFAICYKFELSDSQAISKVQVEKKYFWRKYILSFFVVFSMQQTRPSGNCAQIEVLP